MLTEDSTDAQQNWDKSAEVSSAEFLCQVGEFVLNLSDFPLVMHDM
jgi:hypothetical protein